MCFVVYLYVGFLCFGLSVLWGEVGGLCVEGGGGSISSFLSFFFEFLGYVMFYLDLLGFVF